MVSKILRFVISHISLLTHSRRAVAGSWWIFVPRLLPLATGGQKYVKIRCEATTSVYVIWDGDWLTNCKHIPNI